MRGCLLQVDHGWIKKDMILGGVLFPIYDFLSLPWFFEPQWFFKYLEKFNKFGITRKPLPSGI